MKSILFVLIVYLCYPILLFSQSKTMQVEGYKYIKKNGNWHNLIDEEIGAKLDTNHIIVRIINDIKYVDLDFDALGLPKLPRVGSIILNKFYELEIPPNYDSFRILEQYKKSIYFENVHFNMIGQLLVSPDDEYYADLNKHWNLDKINMSLAWNYSTGLPSTRVAVLDNGTEYSHDDLVYNKWSGTGYDYYAEPYDNDPSPENITNDNNYHGTAVAGVICGQLNNDLGVSGIAGGWNNDYGVSLMSLRVGQDRNIDYAAVVRAIEYAYLNDADVVNCSFKLDGLHPYQKIELDEAIENAEMAGTLIVVASGNFLSTNQTNVRYPATHPYTLAVGATTTLDNRKDIDFPGDWGSCYGSELDIVAPGVQIPTTDISGVYGKSTNDYFAAFRGTSSAAPHVSALAALIQSINPSLSPATIKQIIRENGVDKISGYIYSNGFNEEVGYGRINAYKALKYTFETYGGTVGGINKTITLENDLIIDSDEYVTFLEGTTVLVPEDKKIVVNGSLNVNGTSSNPVTFTSLNSGDTWRGIDIYGNANIDNVIIEKGWGFDFEEGSSGTIKNSIIRKNIGEGITIYKALPTIQNCQIYDNEFPGITIIFNKYISGRAQLLDNLIYNNGDNNIEDFLYGIELNRSSPAIRGNEIHSEEWGISCFSYSSPLLGQLGYYGDNYVHNNSIGLRAHTNSNPFAGENTCIVDGGYNVFTSNSYKHAFAEYNSHILADDNWWGTNPPQSSKFYAGSGCSIDYNPWLTSKPSQNKITGSTSEESIFDEEFSSREQASSLEDDNMQYYNPKWPIMKKLLFARKINWLGDIAGCQNICKHVMEMYPDSSLSLFALDILWESSRTSIEGSAYDLASFNSYLKKLSSSKEKKELYGHAELISAGFESGKSLAISAYDKVYNDYKGEQLSELALFDKFNYYYYELNDMDMAEQIAKKLEEEFPASYLSKRANAHFKSSSASLAKNNLSNSDLAQVFSAIPANYGLSQNYPNPFNPSTSVDFSLPKNSNVVITIHNTLGQVVKKTTYNLISAGDHPFVWDGKNNNGLDMSSGLYILHFSAQSHEGDNESFSKSLKLLLVR